ncbi:hypothetical protein [Xanthomonas campestris]|nr:hypothetical protein [Xanthomonas campestris]MEA9676485.1 hypothetical protein [Xanthomonas campestris pv. raphani]MEA9777030.1 hypothetical protein [Xanthomonas campestris pv. raphani]MEA9916885.1 hypothetical protein [Xanthomonas campestris pv. raphani]
MNSSSPTTVPPNKPIAEGLLGQLLVLIKGSQNISDFTPERLNSTMGQVVQFVKGDERRYRAFGPLTRDWSYGFGVDETKLDGRWFEFCVMGSGALNQATAFGLRGPYGTAPAAHTAARDPPACIDTPDRALAI